MRSPAFVCLLSLLALPTHLPAQVAVVGSSIHEQYAEPGHTYEGTIVVRNVTAEPQHVRLYRTDYGFFADGRSLYEKAGSTARSNAGWVTVSPASTTIPARQTVQLHYRVAVPAPDAAALQGSYWSMIMVEGVADAAGAGPARTGELAVKATIRHGVQVVTHIGRTGTPRVNFSSPRIATAADSGRTLEVDLINGGDRANRINITLELFTADGKSAGTLRSARGLVYPGSSIRQQFTLGALPAGSYTALLMADAGGDAVFGAQYTLKF